MKTSLTALFLAFLMIGFIEPVEVEAKNKGKNKKSARPGSHQKSPRSYHRPSSKRKKPSASAHRSPITGSRIRTGPVSSASKRQKPSSSKRQKPSSSKRQKPSSKRQGGSAKGSGGSAQRQKASSKAKSRPRSSGVAKSKPRPPSAGGRGKSAKAGGGPSGPRSRPRTPPRPSVAKKGGSRYRAGRVTYPPRAKKPSSGGIAKKGGGTRPGAHHHKHRRHKKPNRVTNVIGKSYSNRHWSTRYRNSRSIWNTNYTTINRRPVVVDRSFRNSLNYAYRPRAWGVRPWWSLQTHHSWHRGCWDYGWNRRYQRKRYGPRPRPRYYPPGYRSSVSSAIPWGIAAWSLGRLYFDLGYGSYRNPYSAPPVRTTTKVYEYRQPITVFAGEAEPPSEEDEEATLETKSAEAMERARASFREGDYLAAIKAVDESISYMPADPALHEFRALVLFALGRYGDAAGVLNPVLASGPGWDWATMIGFYPDDEAYAAQLRRLEDYVTSQPDSADSHFLLGYHYMVAGYFEEAHSMFTRVTELEPSDTVARQLRDLAWSTMPDGEEEEIAEEEAFEEESETAEWIAPEEIEGVWVARSVEDKIVTLSLAEDGSFAWRYEGAEEADDVLAGEWAVDDEGQLVLDGDDVQLVGWIDLTDEDTMHFILAGSPEGDPGLIFARNG